VQGYLRTARGWLVRISLALSVGTVTACIWVPPFEIVTEPGAYSVNLIDDGVRSPIPWGSGGMSEAIKHRLLERFPKSSSARQLVAYLQDIGCQCEDLNRNGSVVQCVYKKHRQYTLYKRKWLFFRGESQKRSHVDRVVVTFAAEDDQLPALLVEAEITEQRAE